MTIRLNMLFQRLLAQDKGEDGEFVRKCINRSARFSLLYKSTVVAHLFCENGKWTFRYDAGFKELGLNPIVGFPNLEAVYVSEDLWPFFAYRIPSLKQPTVKKILDKEKIGADDQVKLLAHFGRRTIANPFELVACSV